MIYSNSINLKFINFKQIHTEIAAIGSDITPKFKAKILNKTSKIIKATIAKNKI